MFLILTHLRNVRLSLVQRSGEIEGSSDLESGHEHLMRRYIEYVGHALMLVGPQ